MANMKLIEAKTVGAGGLSSVSFTAIPQTYTDLKVLVSARTTYAQGYEQVWLSLNGNTSNLAMIYLLGTGGAGTVPTSTVFPRFVGHANGATSTANTFHNAEIYFPNYTSNKLKSYSVDSVQEDNTSLALNSFTAGLWSDTAAINTITFTTETSSTFVQNTTFYLYGISSTIASGAKATGGYVTEDASYFYHTFLSSGTFTPTQSLTCDFLVIAGGGGGGGRSSAAGGGAGGLRSSVGTTGGGGSLESPLSLTATAYAVTVGAGGAAGIDNTGGTGSNSVFSTITSNGGGAGARGGYGSSETGGNGGSGGGGGASGGTNPKTGGTGTANQGYAGGNGVNVDAGAAGGGGAGQVGQNGSTSTSPYTGGNGGNGVQITTIANATLTGVSGWYASGGGGAISTPGNAGTSQTGGNASNAGYHGFSAFANTGGGGGGGGGRAPLYPANGGAGGSGLVILRYAK